MERLPVRTRLWQPDSKTPSVALFAFPLFLWLAGCKQRNRGFDARVQCLIHGTSSSCSRFLRDWPFDGFSSIFSDNVLAMSACYAKRCEELKERCDGIQDCNCRNEVRNRPQVEFRELFLERFKAMEIVFPYALSMIMES